MKLIRSPVMGWASSRRAEWRAGRAIGATKDRMRICGVSREVFEPAALEAASGYCSGSIRVLNTLLHRALIIGCEQKREIVGTEVVMDAANEIDLL